jgi:hypothetical protein
MFSRLLAVGSHSNDVCHNAAESAQGQARWCAWGVGVGLTKLYGDQ